MNGIQKCNSPSPLSVELVLENTSRKLRSGAMESFENSGKIHPRVGNESTDYFRIRLTMYGGRKREGYLNQSRRDYSI